MIISKNHTIIRIATDKDTSVHQREYCKIPSKTHPKETVQMYCLTCALPICHTCIADKTHKYHDLDKFVNIAEKYKKYLAQFITETKKEISDHQTITIQDTGTVCGIRTRYTGIYPMLVIENINGDVCVMHMDDYRTVVSVVNNDGQFRFRYPESARDKLRYILISDYRNSLIHQIDSDRNLNGCCKVTDYSVLHWPIRRAK
ncbi:hypothetical protein KUTeg_024363 [Tegillarca granosa]|uniref:B box-type domain-containing protein n=1 Tax=Tegillarca granosa TaxID=220873 RepID=A0ABQ9DXU6_TEGGR|nr:hypothetical protein KUTeg_024363 [Tegillarca granosa]